MRKVVIVFAVLLVGTSLAGVASAIGPRIVAEFSILVDEQTVTGRTVNQVPGPFAPGDEYLYRSSLTDSNNGESAGRMFAHCVVQFASEDQCELVYSIIDRGTIVATGMIPREQLHAGGSWVLAVVGGTGEFENVRGSVTVEVVNGAGDTQDTIHLLP